MRIDPASGFLDSATYLASPNCDARPGGAQPELLVVHGISLPEGQYGGGYIRALFTNRLNTRDDSRFQALDGLRVSAHLLIDRRGQLTQFVPFGQRAWHAGQSWFEGRSDCNDFSIGVELEGTDRSRFAEAQYDRLEQLIPVLQRAYPGIADDRVVGHCHIAPGRKSDPGPLFDWGRLHRRLGIHCPITQSPPGPPCN